MPTTASLYIGATQIITQASYPSPDVQNLTSSGTWTKPSWANWIVYEGIGGGGGGGKLSPAGGAGYVQMIFPASALGATESVTIGAGGPHSTASAGSNGGDTIFHNLHAPGGTGGGASSGQSGAGGGSAQQGYLVGGVVINSQYGGGSGAPDGSTNGGTSVFGASGGSLTSTSNGGSSGSPTFGTLPAGSGGANGYAATSPGGGGAAQADGAPGAARITSYA